VHMRPFLRRALQGAGTAGLAVALSSTPAAAGEGTRLANGAGPTSGLCMSVTNSGRGTSVEMEGCTLNAHQGWVHQDDPYGSWIKLVSQDPEAAGRCLTTHGEGIRVTMDRCSTEPDTSLYDRQLWRRTATSTTGWYQYQSAYWINGTRQCLDVRDNGRSKVVQIWLCGPTVPPGLKGNQLWKYF